MSHSDAVTSTVAADASSYSSLKEQKEAFVTGHSGTTPSELLLVSLSAPIGTFLYHELRLVLGGRQRRRFGTLVAIESIVLLLPMALCQTEFLYPLGVGVLFVEAMIGLVLLFRRILLTTSRDDKTDRTSNHPPSSTNDQSLQFLTSYRSTVSYMTCIAILAVDFRVFPRRFAKTETIGYGLMDLGAGSFVISGGFVSRYARVGCLGEGKNKEGGLGIVLKPVLLRSVPLIVLGLVRFATNRGLEYQEHSSEYGIHWNFFFTLAGVSVLSSLFRWSEGRRRGLDVGNGGGSGGFSYKLLFPVSLLLLYQVALTKGGLQGYIEDSPRHCPTGIGVACNFFAANREGLLGLVGYLGMFLLGEDIARYCIWHPSEMKEGKDDPHLQGTHLFITTVSLWTIHWILAGPIMGIPASRRSTNMTFIVWTLAHNLTILSLTWATFWIARSRVPGGEPSPSPIFSAMNQHGLVVFLVANLLTGAVNLSMNTLDVSDSLALAIIFAYLCSVGGLALVLDEVLKPRQSVVKVE